MTDYTRGTGSGGVMLIRDTGWSVEMYVMAGSSQTYVNEMAFQTTVNGVARSGEIRYPSGGNWLLCYAENVSTTQGVRFYIGATGTGGLGGPTDFWQQINRAPVIPPATVPPAPNPVTFTGIATTSVGANFTSRGNGGSGILEWQIGYGKGSNRQYYVASDGSTTINGLIPGTTYSFWARGRNAVGWGAWSSGRSVKTIAGVRLKVAGVWRTAVLYVKVAGVWKMAVPYVKVAGVWKIAN